MVFVKLAECRTMTPPDDLTAPTGASMVTTIPMLEKKGNDCQCSHIVFQVQPLDVVLDDAFRPVLLFAKGVLAMSLPMAIAVEVRDYQSVYKAQQRRLLTKDPAFLDRHCQAKPPIRIDMVIITGDLCPRLPDPRQPIGIPLRDEQFDLEGIRYGAQPVVRRLERQRSGHGDLVFSLLDLRQTIVNRL